MLACMDMARTFSSWSANIGLSDRDFADVQYHLGATYLEQGLERCALYFFPRHYGRFQGT